jgi:hypothetical protein
VKKGHWLNMSMIVRAKMATADEMRRQKRLGLNAVDEPILDGLVLQKINLELQQTNSIRNLIILLFLVFVSWRGGSINIPGFGISIREIPAFLEISLILSALYIVLIPYIFLSIQLYEGVIGSIAHFVKAEELIDSEIFIASKTPVYLFVKYARKNLVIGRKDGYIMGYSGVLFNGIILYSITVLILLMYIFIVIAIIYIAHTGLRDDVVGWSIYFICWISAIIAFVAASANIVGVNYEMDFDVLEKIAAVN